MPASIEHQLVSAIFINRDFHTVEKLKMEASHFSSAECKAVFNYIDKTFHDQQTYGSVPSWELIHQAVPPFNWVLPQDDIPTLCKQLRSQKLKMDLFRVAQAVSEKAEIDPEEALSILKAGTATIGSANTFAEERLLSEAHDELRREYEIVRDGQGLTGIPFPWKELNEETQGMHAEEYILIYGRMKSMKSWLALMIAIHAYWEAKARVLVWTLEMPLQQVIRRAACIHAQVDYNKLKKGQLNQADEAMFFEAIQELKIEDEAARVGAHAPSFLVMGKDRTNGCGVNALQAKIREFQPDLVIVDGQYLMRDDRQKLRTIDWKAQAHISQDMKDTAQTFHVPIIGVTQANRGSKKDGIEGDLSGISYSDALGQDCDLGILVKKQANKDTGENEIQVAFPGARETKIEGMAIGGVPAIDFSFKRFLKFEEQAAPPQKGPSSGGATAVLRPPVQSNLMNQLVTQNARR